MEAITQDTQQTATEALRFARELADNVAERLLKHFHGVRHAKIKRDGTLVTQADLEADRFITDAIQQRYPDYDIISEELNTRYEGAPWCWIVDPLDGTTNFAQGVPIWGVSIALAYAGWPVMGVIDFPTLGLRYHAVKGAGAFENDQPIEVMPAVGWDDSPRLRNELVAVCSRTVQRYTADIPMKPRILGSAAFNFCLTAAGIALASMEATPKVWDMAAGWLLVHEAGGVVVQLEGAPIFPLAAGQDYATIAYPQLSAPSHSIVAELKQRLRQR